MQRAGAQQIESSAAIIRASAHDMAKEEKGIFVTHHTPMISTLELINHHTGDMIEIYTNLQAHKVRDINSQ